MDLNEYEKLRRKINVKDFEGNNKALNKWLWGFSYIGNASAIFFAYFLVFPALLKTISLHLVNGLGGTLIAFTLTILFLSIFEITKRYFIRNFSSDFMINHKKIKPKNFGWMNIAILLIVLSFYLSIVGSKKLASTSHIKNSMVESELLVKKDSLIILYENRKKIYLNDNDQLRKLTNNLREKLAETPISYVNIRREYQNNIDKNSQIISNNQNEIVNIDNELKNRLLAFENEIISSRKNNQNEDAQNILLFIIIVIFNELIIIGGIYFREYYEYTLYEINKQKFDKVYLKRDRYRALITYIYNDGKCVIGDKVMPGLELKRVIADRANIPNSNKIIDEFLHDMDKLGIFTTTGKRRYIGKTYYEALEIIEHYDDTLRVLENMK